MNTTQDTLDAFSTAMHEAGMIVNEPLIADGLLHRCHVEGDKPGSKNGAYCLHMDGLPSGYFEHWKTGIKSTWCQSGKRYPMTMAMRQQIEQARQQRQSEQQQAHRLAAEKARFVWGRGNPIMTQSEHPYLIKKQVQPHGLRMVRDGVLMVPLFNEVADIVNMQFIDAEGNKQFLSGGQKKGRFSTVGFDIELLPWMGNCVRLIICEGWATGASLYEDTGTPVIVAMDAGNLEPVAVAMRNIFNRPIKTEIIIAGDNDLSGKGQESARKAALACGGKYIIPATPGYDWNDAINAKLGRTAQ